MVGSVTRQSIGYRNMNLCVWVVPIASISIIANVRQPADRTAGACVGLSWDAPSQVCGSSGLDTKFHGLRHLHRLAGLGYPRIDEAGRGPLFHCQRGIGRCANTGIHHNWDTCLLNNDLDLWQIEDALT